VPGRHAGVDHRGGAGGVAAADRDVAAEAQQPADQRRREQLGLGHEAGVERQVREQQRIGQRRVVGDHHAR
jgi:hypothetical protein